MKDKRIPGKIRRYKMKANEYNYFSSVSRIHFSCPLKKNVFSSDCKCFSSDLKIQPDARTCTLIFTGICKQEDHSGPVSLP